MKVVYIFGAGASASIDKSVPVMANFFEKAIDMLDEDNKAFLIAFAFAEEARSFPSNPEVENLGIQMGMIGRLMERTAKTGKHETDEQQTSFIKEELANSINAYKAAFKSDGKRLSANLEDVFSTLEGFRVNNAAADQTYDRLQYVINGLFNQLDKDLQDKFAVSAHHGLGQFVATNTEDIDHTFISFNYDLWLEKALYNKKIWHPADGHGSYRFEYFSQPVEDIVPFVGSVPDAIKFTDNHLKSKVKVLKPHGSLSWRFSNKNNEKRENGLIILEKDEFSCVAYNDTCVFPPVNFPQRGTELSLIPLIVPPTPNKIRSHPLFWQTDKDVYNALRRADIVVIVGWSMPPTDKYLQDTIFRALNNREDQIKKLIVCDKQESSEQLLSRFESVFMPREMKSCLGGFSRKFVDDFKKEL